MRRRHFEALRPICPVCRMAGGESPLRIAHVAREADGHIVEGVLHCSNQNCLREFPVLDAIPLIVPNIRQYVSEHLLEIFGRQDLTELTESLLGDCCGPESAFDRLRQQVSSYAWDHYGDLDPSEPSGAPRPGSMLRCLEIGQQFAESVPRGPILDAGCAVGRGSFALADRAENLAGCAGTWGVAGAESSKPQRDGAGVGDSAGASKTQPQPPGPSTAKNSHGIELVLGVDLNFAMLRLASEILRHGTVQYARRRVGLVYERREFPARFAGTENVDFWACDAAALPFPADTFSLAVGLNVLDCVYAPIEFLTSLAGVLREGGKAVFACPYDWSPAATPLEAWLGGHSQRAPGAGSSAAVLRALLTPGAHPASIRGLELIAECDHLPWHVRLHERSTMTYEVHLAVARKSPPA